MRDWGLAPCSVWLLSCFPSHPLVVTAFRRITSSCLLFLKRGLLAAGIWQGHREGSGAHTSTLLGCSLSHHVFHCPRDSGNLEFEEKSSQQSQAAFGLPCRIDSVQGSPLGHPCSGTVIPFRFQLLFTHGRLLSPSPRSPPPWWAHPHLQLPTDHFLLCAQTALTLN